MIVGRGLIAKAFTNNCLDDVIIFASGVSNSKALDETLFKKEIDLLNSVIAENNDSKKLVYFSSYSIDNAEEKESLYVKHKLKIEEYIKEKTSRYLIIRTGNIVGHSNNSHTIFNFLFSKIKNSESFDLWLNASRNFLDIDHLVLMVNKTLEKGITNETIYLLNPLDIELSDIVMLFEEGLNKKAHYTKILKGNQIYTDKTFSTLLFKELNISVENYFKQLILKYCNEN